MGSEYFGARYRTLALTGGFAAYTEEPKVSTDARCEIDNDICVLRFIVTNL